MWCVSSGRGDGSNREEKQCCWWCAACGGHYDWRAPNRILVIQLSANVNEANVFKAHAAPLGLCDDLVNALQQEDGDSPIDSIVTGLHEKSRKVIMYGLRNLIDVDKHGAVDVGGLRRGTKSIQVKKPQVSEDFPRGGYQRRRRELEKWVRCEPSKVRSKLISTGGNRRGWMRTGTRCVRPFVKEMMDKSGKCCAVTTKSCTRRR